MWHERKKHLSKPLDFLKVGHHGSINATPWNRDADAHHEMNQLFNAILPLPAAGKKPTAKCVVSTKRKQYDTIPDAQLLTEIAKRVSNTKNYLQEFINANNDFDPEIGTDSILTFLIQGGRTYFVEAQGFGASTGEFALNVFLDVIG